MDLRPDANGPTEDKMLEYSILALALTLYMLPSVIAALRDHPSAGGIFVINLFLGWIGLGWVIALAWSLSSVRA